MSRLIDADKLSQDMYHEAFETDTDMQKWDSGCWIRYKLFENVIAKQPIVDAEPIRHGHWKDKYNDGDWHCSVCGAIVEKDEQKRHNWYRCYHCGAKMDEVTE